MAEELKLLVVEKHTILLGPLGYVDQILFEEGCIVHTGNSLKGEGGVPWVQIMENELECLGDRRGHDGHLAKKRLPCRDLAVVTRQQLAISAFISKWSF